MKEDIFSKLVRFERSMQARLSREIVKKDKAVLEMQSRLEKQKADTLKKSKADALEFIKKKEGAARLEAKKEAEQYKSLKKAFEQRFRHRKKEIMKEVIAHMFR